jgi:pSer/pThr/pTyr-binding forkhead associated (FHA) protein
LGNTAPPLAPDREGPPRPLPGSRLRLTFLSGTRKDSFVEQAGAVVRIGRAKGNTVWTPEDPAVSDQHAKIVRLEDAYVLMDLESASGTLLNGHRVERAALRDRDVIGLGAGGPELRIQILTPDLAERLSQATVVIPNFGELARRAGETFFIDEVPLDREQLTLGRGPEADLRLESPIVSRSHARLTRENGGLTLQDLGSTNGTFLGSKRIEEAPLRDGDRVVVGPFILEVTGLALRLLDTRNRARLDARELSVNFGGRPILDGVSLSLPPGSLSARPGPASPRCCARCPGRGPPTRARCCSMAPTCTGTSRRSSRRWATCRRTTSSTRS